MNDKIINELKKITKGLLNILQEAKSFPLSRTYIIVQVKKLEKICIKILASMKKGE